MLGDLLALGGLLVHLNDVLDLQRLDAWKYSFTPHAAAAKEAIMWQLSCVTTPRAFHTGPPLFLILGECSQRMVAGG